MAAVGAFIAACQTVPRNDPATAGAWGAPGGDRSHIEADLAGCRILARNGVAGAAIAENETRSIVTRGATSLGYSLAADIQRYRMDADLIDCMKAKGYLFLGY
jgi:hypothetical protein